MSLFSMQHKLPRLRKVANKWLNRYVVVDLVGQCSGVSSLLSYVGMLELIDCENLQKAASLNSTRPVPSAIRTWGARRTTRISNSRVKVAIPNCWMIKPQALKPSNKFSIAVLNRDLAVAFIIFAAFIQTILSGRQADKLSVAIISELLRGKPPITDISKTPSSTTVPTILEDCNATNHTNFWRPVL